MRISVYKFLCMVFIFSIPLQSSAWGVLGHRIVGEVAETYLTKKAKKNIAAILGNESVAMSSNWADFVKSDSTYDFMYNWHFINLPGGLSEKAVREYLAQDTLTDIYTRIKFCTEQLKRKDLDISSKQVYLKALIHFVGDLHQPMHVGRYDDLGGNRIKLNWFRSPSNLHQIWDEKLIEFQQLSYTEYTKAINFCSTAQKKIWQSDPLETWVYESYSIAQLLYAGISESGESLSYKYNYDHVATLNQQLLKAGVRLAGLLNEIFG